MFYSLAYTIARQKSINCMSASSFLSRFSTNLRLPNLHQDTDIRNR